MFVGAISGGVIASHVDGISEALHLQNVLGSSLFIVFILSSVGRIAVAIWFIHFTQADTQIHPHGNMVQLVLRIARFNAISGVSFDWLTTIKKSTKKPD